MDGYGSMAGTGTSANHKHTRNLPQASVSASHKAGTCLVATVHHIDLRKIAQRIKQTKKAFARHKIDPVDTVIIEHLKQGMGGTIASQLIMIHDINVPA
jgi:hypothetical protein